MFVAATWRSSAGTLPGPASCRGRGGGRPPGTAQSGTDPLSPEHKTLELFNFKVTVSTRLFSICSV